MEISFQKGSALKSNKRQNRQIAHAHSFDANTAIGKVREQVVMAHTRRIMFSSIGNPEIIDIAIVGATILMAAAGFWRGVVKEVFVSTSLLLASMVGAFSGVTVGASGSATTLDSVKQ